MKPLKNKVAYFAGCGANYFSPEIGRSTVFVLRKNGLKTIYPDQVCCALPHLIYGNRSAFKKRAEKNIKSLIRADCDIVATCPSCALTLKSDYPDLVNSRESKIVADRTYDIVEYLAMLKDENALNLDFQPIKRRVIYHAPCHLKALGKEHIERRLKALRMIPGVAIEQIDRGCCGMGGSFGNKGSAYAMSMDIGRDLFEGIKESNPDCVSTDCPACSWQISAGSERNVTHPILLMGEAYGFKGLNDNMPFG